MSRIPDRQASFHRCKDIVVAKHHIWTPSNGADYAGIQIVHYVWSYKQNMRKTSVVLSFKLEHEIESNSTRPICIEESRICNASQMFWRRKKETESRVLVQQRSLFPRTIKWQHGKSHLCSENGL
jgi:hypothetical protein